MNMTRILLLFSFSIFSITGFSQTTDYFKTAVDHLKKQAPEWGISDLDIADMAVSDQYQSRHNGVTHVYLSQRFDGVKIYNAQAGVHLDRQGNVIFTTNRLIPDIYAKVETHIPQISPADAVKVAAVELGITEFVAVALKSDREAQEYLFDRGSIAHEDIPVGLVYFYTTEGKLRLAWDLSIDQVEQNDYATMRIDAVTGELLDRKSYTVSCSFEPGMYHRHTDDCLEPLQFMGLHNRNKLDSGYNYTPPAMENSSMEDRRATYYVFPFPSESPAHGERIMVQDKFNEMASPFGWHDVDGEPGPEFTITRGNNVHAWPANRANPGDPGGEPDGGEELFFEFPIDADQEPTTYVEAATVNLFYSNNMIHDISYAYGFDEVSGNFQQNNYGRGGTAGDPVRARAQDSGGTNNATFSSPPDGSSGTMRMYIWTRGSNSEIRGIEPASIARSFVSGRASFGAPITDVPVTAPLAYARAAGSNPSLACESIVNQEEVAGKIAIVDRGSCFFIEKVLNVQLAGAAACIVCNFENSAIPMGAGDGIPNPNIPSVMLSSSDCNILKELMDSGVEVIMSLVNEDFGGPTALDGTLDNGIVAHEYGHGISIRLTGGPELSCLGNSEQMGEGWSDYFTLITTVRPGDTGEMPRGIGTFVTSQPNDGRGIRRYPYSTDMNINPLTYDDLITDGIPHPLGEVWVAMLWDLYWAMVDVYGFDEDILYGTGGNNMAIQLVMDGMKLQACSPGFVDGRDAILAADRVLYDGANQCLIWEVFARRGLGVHADQGSPDSHRDGRENFDLPKSCLNDFAIYKTMTPVIKAGDNIEISLEIGNYTGENAQAVIIQDEIPEGTTYVPGSSSIPVETIGNILQFVVEEIQNEEEVVITYELSTPGNRASERVFYDDMEDEISEFNWEFISAGGNFPWIYTDELPYEGQFSWVIYTAPELDQSIYNFDPITLPAGNPVLRFFHNYDTDPGFNGGFISVSNDGGFTWTTIPEMIRGDYRGKLAFTTFAIPDLKAFWGPGVGWKETLVDLTQFAGQDVHVRFRYGSDGGAGRTIAWSLDNIEVVDALLYNSEACVVVNSMEVACAFASEGGTFVEAGISTSTNQPGQSEMEVRVFPNPAGSKVNVQLRQIEGQHIRMQILGIDGRVIRHIEDNAWAGSLNMEVNVQDLAQGVYMFRIQTDTDTIVQKVMIQR
jgi:extracellular elastinolytic metalloproteinase